MVNKAFLSLAAVVLFAVFGTGVFVGMQVGGLADEGPSGPEATEAGPQPTDTPASDAPATEASESTATPAPSEGGADDDGAASEREQIPSREFNERNISSAIVENINDAREAAGLSRLSTTGTTAETVRQMAKNHSEAMADAGRVRHTIDGVSSADRYEQNDLIDTCQFQVRSFIVDASNDDLEVIGQTYAGQEYPDNGTQRFNGNDTAVATALTEDWLSTTLFNERLTYQNAERIGVGVTVTRNGVVYATANIC